MEGELDNHFPEYRASEAYNLRNSKVKKTVTGLNNDMFELDTGRLRFKSSPTRNKLSIDNLKDKY